MKKGMILLKEFSRRSGVPYPTLVRWVREGRIPGALMETSPTGSFWVVPESALKTWERPKLGRPPKAPKGRGDGSGGGQGFRRSGGAAG